MKDAELKKIKAELNGPNKAKYKDKSDSDVAEMFAVADQPDGIDRDTLDAGELVGVITPADLKGLKAEQSAYLSLVISAKTVPVTTTLKNELLAMFGEPTKTAISKLLKRTATLAEVLQIPSPTPNDISDITVRGKG